MSHISKAIILDILMITCGVIAFFLILYVEKRLRK